jgi:hypothetical protein
MSDLSDSSPHKGVRNDGYLYFVILLKILNQAPCEFRSSAMMSGISAVWLEPN